MRSTFSVRCSASVHSFPHKKLSPPKVNKLRSDITEITTNNYLSTWIRRIKGVGAAGCQLRNNAMVEYELDVRGKLLNVLLDYCSNNLCISVQNSELN